MALTNYKPSHYRLKENDTKSFFDYLMAEVTYEIHEENQDRALSVLLLFLHLKAVQYAVNANIDDRLLELLTYLKRLSSQLDQLHVIVGAREEWSERDLERLEALNRARVAIRSLVNGLELVDWDTFGELTYEFHYYAFLNESEQQMKDVKDFLQNIFLLKRELEKARIETTSLMDALNNLSAELYQFEYFFETLADCCIQHKDNLDDVCKVLILCKLGQLCREAVDTLLDTQPVEEISRFTTYRDDLFLQSITLKEDHDMNNVLERMKDVSEFLYFSTDENQDF